MQKERKISDLQRKRNEKESAMAKSQVQEIREIQATIVLPENLKREDSTRQQVAEKSH